MGQKTKNLLEVYQDYQALNSTIYLLEWDQQVMLPPKSGNYRAKQLGILSRLSHEALISSNMLNAYEQLEKEQNKTSDDLAILRVLGRKIRNARKIPVALSEQKARLSSESHAAWQEAREKNDFSIFAPFLEKTFKLAKQTADYLGYGNHFYDALLDIYEEGCTTQDCIAIFDSIRVPLTNIAKEAEKLNPKKADMLEKPGDKTLQKEIHLEMLKDLHFNTERGRLDECAHPMCMDIHPHDVRITTRFIPLIYSSYLSTLHEIGHGLYEQNISSKWVDTPISGGVSLGIHESQSRFWENIIGRSKGFWNKYLPKLKPIYPHLQDISVDEWIKLINYVSPTPIRTESDEVTYNLHIMIRFELELAILNGDINVKDLPHYWKEKMEKYLGITPKNDVEGCLQDIHWAEGIIGYFPTYTIGNILCYQFKNKMEQDLTNFNQLLDDVEYKPILNWLVDKIHTHGQYYSPKELVELACKEKMNPIYFIEAMKKRYLST